MRRLITLTVFTFIVLVGSGQQNHIPIFRNLDAGKFYFSPILPYPRFAKVMGLHKIGEPSSSIKPLSNEYDFDITVSSPKYLFAYKKGEPYDSSKLYPLEKDITAPWLTLAVDTSQIIGVKEEFYKSTNLERYRSTPTKFKLIQENGQVSFIQSNRDKVFTLKAYLVSISNLTAETQILSLVDDVVEITQEAKDKNGNWRPIELARPIMLCSGMNYWHLLKPNEQLITTIFQYKGTYKTQLRVKLESRKKVIYSQPFWGSINYSQFDMSKFYFLDWSIYEK